jgi:hypothetical protein
MSGGDSQELPEDNHHSDWEDMSDGDFEGEEEFPDLPPLPADGVSSSDWHKQVIRAVEARSTTALDALLERALSERHSILNYAEDMIAVVGKAICQGIFSKDLQSSLEMLMFIIVEHGSAAELMICFADFFSRDNFNSAEVEFFIPNIQGALLRLKAFRLYWLSSYLSQIDDYAVNSDLWQDVECRDESGPKVFSLHIYRGRKRKTGPMALSVNPVID